MPSPLEAPSLVAERNFQDIFIALRVRNFRLFWFGQLISLSGTWMQTIGQAWLVLNLTQSPFAVGTVTTLQFLPITLLVLFGGVVADRVPKRRFLVGTQTAAMLQALTLGVLVTTGPIRLWHVYLLALTLGLTNAFDNPTRQAFVPEMVGKDLVTNAVPLNSTLFNAARIVGPAIGGVTIATVGIDGTFYLNAASFIPVIIALLMMRPSEFYPVEKGQGRLFEQLREGIRVRISHAAGDAHHRPHVLHRDVRLQLQHRSAAAGEVRPARRLGRLRRHDGRARRRLVARGADHSLYAARRREADPAWGSRLQPAADRVGLSHWFALTLALLIVLGFAAILFSASANTRLQILTPDHLRGRVMSLYILLFAGTTPIGAFLLGNAAERIGVQKAVVLFGVISGAGRARRGCCTERLTCPEERRPDGSSPLPDARRPPSERRFGSSSSASSAATGAATDGSMPSNAE